MLRCCLALLTLCLVGCNSSAPPAGAPAGAPPSNVAPGDGSPAPAPSASGAAPAAPPAVTEGTQLVEGPGFSLQAPADWSVGKQDAIMTITSPGAAPVMVSLLFVPVKEPQTPAGGAQNAVDVFRGPQNRTVESQTMTTVAGCPATRLVTTEPNPTPAADGAATVKRMVVLIVTADDGVLTVQAEGEDAQVQAALPQIEAIVQTIALK